MPTFTVTVYSQVEEHTWAALSIVAEGRSRFRRDFRLSLHVEGGVKEDKVLPPVGKSAELRLPLSQGLSEQC